MADDKIKKLVKESIHALSEKESNETPLAQNNEDIKKIKKTTSSKLFSFVRALTPFKIIMIAAGIFLFLWILVQAIIEKQERHGVKTIPHEEAVKSQEHLEAARKAIDEGRDAEALAHLKAITRASEAWNTDGKVLWDKIGPYIIKQKKQKAALLKQQTTKLREDFARIYENELLNNGMDAYVSTSGSYHEVLEVEYILINRPFAHKFSRDVDQMAKLRKLGFNRVILKDGHGFIYVFVPGM